MFTTTGLQKAVRPPPSIVNLLLLIKAILFVFFVLLKIRNNDKGNKSLPQTLIF